MPGHLRRRSLALTLLLTMTIGLVAGLRPQIAAAAAPSLTTATIAAGLQIPWDVGFLPDGRMLVTERPGRVRIYDSGTPGAALLQTVTIPDVWAVGEAGLMGIAVDVDFASNQFVYVCASREYAGTRKNEVLRYTLASTGQWVNAVILIGGMAAANIHNGCALEMDRFGMLWITMGDAADESRAQNRNSLNGKVLRIDRAGGVPGDNPMIAGSRNAVYSMGHRNPQGIAFRPGTDQVYIAEHGPELNDEINLISAGGNYGWPCYTGSGTPYHDSGCAPASTFNNPVWSSGGSTIATSGAAFTNGAQWQDFNGHLWVSQLKERDVRRFALDTPGTGLAAPIQTLFDGSWGRLRGMVSGPGGQLYVTTSNGNNDQVIRISPATPTVERIWGANRFATAAALSQAAYAGGAANVMVATGRNFPDALAGSAAAGQFAMPILLVETDSIPAPTLNEIDRLNPQKIFVLGGPVAVSEGVRTQLEAYASTGEVERLSGDDRYATAARISAEFYAPNVPAAFIATGTGFADALAGGPAAALNDSPLLLVRSNAIPDATAAELSRLAPQRIYVLGGPAVINDDVAAQLDAYTTGPVTRLWGADRYATAAAIARAFWSRGPGFIATGQNFPDALAGGAVAGRNGEPVLLVKGSPFPAATGQEILRLGSVRLFILGGPAAVSGGVEAILKKLVGTP